MQAPPAQTVSSAQAWLEEAHRHAQKLPAETRVHALQRLSVLVRSAAPESALDYFREAFRAAGDVGDATRRGRIQYQLVRDLAESAPSAALDLALEMGAYDFGAIDWRLAAATMALDAHGGAQSGRARAIHHSLSRLCRFHFRAGS